MPSAYLRDYLRTAFDPYDYLHVVRKYLEDRGIDQIHGVDVEEIDEDYELGEIFVESADKNQMEDFKAWVKENATTFDYDSPPYESLEYSKFIKPTWLVHFTDDPWNIFVEGFAYGHPDFSGLHLTTHKRERRSKEGYNFAFLANSRYATFAARDHRYGKHAVVFWGSGVMAYHWGDEEDQVIVWGPSVNTDLIFPIYNDYDEWAFEYNGKEYKRGDFSGVVTWVIANYIMVQRILKK